MKKYKIIFWAGCGFIFLSLAIASMQNYLMYFFGTSVRYSYQVPASQMFHLDKDTFEFAVAADTGGQNGPIEKIIQKSRRAGVSFILHLGDLVRYKNPSHFSWIVSELEEKLKDVPFYAVPGNHEIKNEAGIIDKTSYMKIFGQTYYWFGYGNTLFIALDSSEEQLDEKQLRWLRLTLDKIRPQFKYCVIYSHVPPLNENSMKHKHLTADSTRRLANVLRGKNINLLLFGHVHRYSKGEFVGIPMYILPPSGQASRDENDRRNGYLIVSVTPQGINNVKLKYLNRNGNTEHFEAFLSHSMVQDEIRSISVWMFAVGAVLTVVSFLLKKTTEK